MNDSGNVTLQKNGDTLSSTDSYPQWFTVVLCITIMVTFVAGVMLNLSVLIGGYSKLKTERGNYFVRSLSFIDLILCFTVMPMTIAVLVKYPNLNAVICCLHEGSVSFAVTASAVCIAFVSLDRYGAIVTPTDRKINSRNITFIKRIICVTSGLGFLIPFFNLAFVSSIDMITNVTNPGINCRKLLFAINPTFIYEIYYLIFFALAVVTVLVSYFKIIRVAKNKIKNIPRANRTKGVISKQDTKIQERKMISLTAAIVCSFVICWGSYVIVSMCTLLIPVCVSFDMVKLFLLVLATTTTSIHPLVYTFVHRDLRHAYVKKIMMESTNRTRLYSSKIVPTTIVQDMIIKSASQGLSVGMNTSVVDMEILSTGQRNTSKEVSVTSPDKKWHFHHKDPTEGNIVTVASYDTNLNEEQPSTSGLQNTRWPTSKSRKSRMISRSISSMDNDYDEDFEINPLPEVVVSARNLTDHTGINKYRHLQDAYGDSCITTEKHLSNRMDLDNTKESLM